MTRFSKLAATISLAAGLAAAAAGSTGVLMADSDKIMKKPNSSYSVVAAQSFGAPNDYDRGADCISDGVKGNATPAGGCGNGSSLATPA